MPVRSVSACVGAGAQRISVGCQARSARPGLSASGEWLQRGVVRPPGLLPRPLRDGSCKGEACTLAPERREDTFSREAPHQVYIETFPAFLASSLSQHKVRLCAVAKKTGWPSQRDRLAVATRQAGGGNKTGWRWQRDRLAASSFAPRLPDRRVPLTAVATTHATAIVCT